MNKEDLIVGIHGNSDLVGGRYNVLSSFSAGLLKGFNNIGIKAYTTQECFEKGLVPNLTVGFNVLGVQSWGEYLKNDITNIMWSVDSVFYQNIEAVEQFYANPKFVLFNVSPSDNEALGQYFPGLKNAYMPHGVDLELWKKQDVKKEYEIVFLSSIEDYDLKIDELKNSMPSDSFNLLMMIYETWLNASNLSLWQVYQIFKKETELTFNRNQYNFVFKNLTYLVTYAKRAQLIQSLKDFNVKVFGEGPWEKYVSGNVQYMGKCDLMQSVDVMNKAKIVLHTQPSQLTLGLHERILNASAVESFVLSTKNKSIETSFMDDIGYFNPDMSDVEEQVAYYLNNDDERLSKAESAREIVQREHTWDVRAQQIFNMTSQ